MMTSFFRRPFLTRAAAFHHCLLTITLLITGVCLLLSPGVSAAPKEQKNVPLILKSANSNENMYTNGEFISILKGNVIFLYDDITIRSDEATWWRNEGKVDFKHNVRVTQKAQVLTCDRLNFTKEITRSTRSAIFTSATPPNEPIFRETRRRIFSKRRSLPLPGHQNSYATMPRVPKHSLLWAKR